MSRNIVFQSKQNEHGQRSCYNRVNALANTMMPVSVFTAINEMFYSRYDSILSNFEHLFRTFVNYSILSRRSDCGFFRRWPLCHASSLLLAKLAVLLAYEYTREKIVYSMSAYVFGPCKVNWNTIVECGLRYFLCNSYWCSVQMGSLSKIY